MAVKVLRRVDDQGRIIIPSNIREMLNLSSGCVVEVDVTDEGEVKLIPATERCDVCGKSVKDKHHAEIKAGKETKRICYDCSQKIMKHIMK